MTFKLLYLNPTTGEHGLLPDLGTVNLGGTDGPTFYVNGRPLLFADGTSTDGSMVSVLTLQGAYVNSPSGGIDLTAGKDLLVTALNSQHLRVSAETGLVTVTNDLHVGAVSFTAFYGQVAPHVAPGGVRHTATQVSVQGPFSVIAGGDVETALLSVDAALSSAAASAVKTHEHVQASAATTWVIAHNKASTRAVASLYDQDGIEILADEVRVLNASTVQVMFDMPQAGRAVVLLF